MADNSGSDGLRERLARSGEDALGRLAQDLLENPLINGAIARAFEAREKASQAQEVAFGALNLPSAADIERLTRRVRSLSQRLEGIEDGVDRLDERLAGLQDEIVALRKALPKPATAKRAKPAKPAADASS
jgi:chromosome segregation ATPase